MKNTIFLVVTLVLITINVTAQDDHAVTVTIPATSIMDIEHKDGGVNAVAFSPAAIT